MRLDRANERRGIILLVVLSLLTLFAIVGITFVLYADSEAASARIAREAETRQRADVDPEQALALFLSQLIYDVHDDLTGAGSSLRGHSLARTMYGHDYFSGMATNGSSVITLSSTTGLKVGDSVTVTLNINPNNILYSAIKTITPNMSITLTSTWNYPTGAVIINVSNINITPFNGIGRLHYTYPDAAPTPAALQRQDDYILVNYTWFQADGFVRDPERVGTRTEDQLRNNTQPNPYVCGNAPYTYPDLNSFFLAAVKADGTVLTPSFHRKWLFNPNNDFNDMTNNPNWTNDVGKYLTVRPRLQEHPNFPAPDDATGDVKNLIGSPGGNDSIWIDIGAPVMTAPDGTKFKMLFAPLIVDLDNRINLNTAGNIVAHPNTPNAPHVSNQGWGPWEVNLAKVLNTDQTDTNPPIQYINLFTGKSLGPRAVRGKYTSNPNPPPAYTPTTPNTTIPTGPLGPAGNSPHFYAQVDFNGLNEDAPGTPSSPPIPPGIAPNDGNNPPPIFPLIQQGYRNGGTENVDHPLLYNTFQTTLFDTTGIRAFRPSDMESLLRTNSLQYPVDAGSSALISDLFRLCPQHFGPGAANLKYRHLVTTLSMDFGRPGVSPYWYSQDGVNPAPYLLQDASPTPPAGSAVSFPTVTPGQPLPNISNTATQTPLNPNSEFDATWRAVSANLFPIRINLNRPLPPYPHMGQNKVGAPSPPYDPPLATYGVAYDLTPPSAGKPNPVYTQYMAALNARQGLANDIYRRLVAITGVGLPANPAAPDPADPNLAARRWLAQLAVNIVDFIDEDDINTPFNFYNHTDGLPAANIGATQGKDDPNPTGANPLYWVFGTELPKVVLNEVLAEAQNPDPTQQTAVEDENVKVWLELFNTMQPPATPVNTQVQDTYRVPLYMSIPGAAGAGYSPYRITIAQTLMNQPIADAPAALPDATSNVLGKAYIAAPFPQSTTDADFADPANVQQVGGGAQLPPPNGTYKGPGVDPGSFFLIGPPDPGDKYKDPFVAETGTDPGVPPTTPVLRKANITYKPTWSGASTTDERTTGLTVMLRRLANPYLPFNGNPSIVPDPTHPDIVLPNPLYNPYVTIDYIQNVPIQSNKVGPGLMLVRSDGPTPSNNNEPARAQVRSNGTIQSNTRLVQSSPAAALYASRGKTQPYAAYTTPRTDGGVPQAPAGSNAPEGSPVINQEVNAAGTPTAITTPSGVTHSFGRANYPLPPSKHYDWLVHLDRQAISPMELLHVSGYQPYQLTQRFLLGSDSFAPPNQANVTNMFRHYVPWLDAPLSSPSDSIINMSCPWWFDANLPADQSHRLYRLFEFLECGDRASGVSTSSTSAPSNIPGKVNINTIWDPEIFRAICDANLSIGLPSDDSITDQIFQQLIASRSPNLTNKTIGPVNIAAGSVPTSYQLDRPFLPLSTGLSAAGQQYPNGAGIQDTILRPNPSSSTLRLFQNPNDTSSIHSYLQTQLLTKIYNNLTTRSNVFAVWVTVGFFEVTDPGTNPPTLGAEIGRSEGRHVRHRMFAIVNRANVSVYSGPPSSGTSFNPFSNTGIVPYYSIID